MRSSNKLLNFVFITFSFLFLSLFVSSEFALAKVRIVTSVPNLAAIAKEIGGDKVEVKSIARGYQDPHFVDAKPSFLRDLNRADFLIYSGLGLEIGWLPVLITGSRNSNITSTISPGHLDASTLVPVLLEVPTTRVDRSTGDIHPGGNPHYLLDPRNGIAVSKGIADRLKQIDPENSSFFEENFWTFSKKLNAKINEWEIELAPFKGTKVVTYHKSWIYFVTWAGFVEFGQVEPKPGIPPTPSHVANLIKRMEDSGVKLIIAESYYPQKTINLIAQRTGSTFLVLPENVGGAEGVNRYFDLFDLLVGEITSVLKNITATSKLN